MTSMDLRPLSLGETLDRTFTLYRSHFLLFIGLAGVPQLLVLVMNVIQTLLPAMGAGGIVIGIWFILYLIAAVVAYLYSQGASIYAVSRLYLGRGTDMMDSFRAVGEDLGAIFVAGALTTLAAGVGIIFLIVPGIYIFCRLLVVIPVAVIEKRASLSRAWELTQGHVGRAFIIALLYVVLLYAITIAVTIPLGIAITLQPGLVTVWTIIFTTITTVCSAIILPIFLIATSIFYYDLRVRKEAFDLQMMIDPDASQAPAANMRTILPE